MRTEIKVYINGNNSEFYEAEICKLFSSHDVNIWIRREIEKEYYIVFGFSSLKYSNRKEY